MFVAHNLRQVSAVLALLVASACGHVCTLVGCDSGLFVALKSAPARPFTIEVLVPSGQGLVSRHSYECATEYCGARTLVNDITLTRVLVRVTAPNGVRETEYSSIEYARSQPNGPDCSPLCVSASVVVPIP